MRFAYSSNAYTRTSLDDALASIAALGFGGVEILCDRPHWFASEVTDREADRVGKRLDELGLGISNLNANTANGYQQPAPLENVFEPSLSNPDAQLRGWRAGYTRRALELAARLAAPCVSVTSGRPLPGCPPERGLALFAESLKPLCETAARLGVRLAIEYEPGLLVECAAELREVLERVGAPELGANLDIGHSHLVGESPEEVVAALTGRVWNVHVEDILGTKHFHLVPGDGDLPFTRYFDALREDGYAGYLTLELYTYPDRPAEAGRRSLDYLRQLPGSRRGEPGA